ncbi:MAG: hypothetical protein A2142_09720 [candidate division Zixibacteria bacterium RBG_16_48_11]|nr:MAG: hypothetical protein A2142_09720 [candidate division Zixibacteria bacterium RBG_16_48_11]
MKFDSWVLPRMTKELTSPHPSPKRGGRKDRFFASLDHARDKTLRMTGNLSLPYPSGRTFP